MEETAKQSPKGRQLWSWILRLVVVGVICWWLIGGADLDALLQALTRINPLVFLLALSLVTLNMYLASVRWASLMSAFGARDIPAGLVLFRIILIGHFYNTFVPGSVGGDMVRGYVARRCFDDTSSSFAVVVSDRVIGLSTLSLVLLVGLLLGPRIVDLASLAPWIIGIIALGLVVVTIGYFSKKLTALWAKIPQISRMDGVLIAATLSICAHISTIICFASISATLQLDVSWLDLCLIVPLGLIAGVIPLAIAGIGPREVALVGVLGLVGVTRADALALSLGFAATIIILALVGGLLQMTIGYTGVDDATSDSDTT